MAGQAAVTSEGLDAGFDVYRSKPITPEAVAAAVVDALKLRRTPRRLRRAWIRFARGAILTIRAARSARAAIGKT